MSASDAAKRVSASALVAASLYALVSAVYDAVFGISARWLMAPDVVAYSREYITQIDPIDMSFLVRGISSKPTFISTFAWWHQTWAGIVPFWRPLTSQLFWLEYRLFGFDHLNKWQWVGIASHFLVVGLIAVYALRLGPNRWIAPLAVLFFAGSRSLWPANWLSAFMATPSTPGDIALDSWKNQPELWAAACAFGAILAALSGRWALSLACTAGAICFKESGWYLFLIVPIALWGAGRAQTIPRWVFAAGAVLAVVLILFRASAGGAVFWGYHQFADYNGLSRYLLAVQGFYFGLIRSPSAASAILAACLLALLLWRRGGDRIRLGLSAASVVVCVLIDSRLQLTSTTAAMAQYTEWDLEMGNTVLGFVWLALAWVLLTSRTYRRIGIALVGLILASAISMALASQVVRHVLYLTYAFQSLLMAVVAAAGAERAQTWWHVRRTRAISARSIATQRQEAEVSKR